MEGEERRRVCCGDDGGEGEGKAKVGDQLMVSGSS